MAGVHGRGEDVGAPAVAFHAQRDDGGMLEQEQGVRDPVVPPLLGQLTLKVERLGVGDHAQTPDGEGTHRP